MSNLDKLEKDDYYMTVDGYIVFTEKYLLKRGYCCDNGCRHCPYTYREKKNRPGTKNKDE
jgi:hypothetical protein